MTTDADELFRGGDEPPLPDPTRGIRRLLLVGAVLDTVGAPCFLSVPGALITLYTWQRATEEVERVRSGALGAEMGPPLRALRKIAAALLVWCCISMLTQTAILGWLASGGAEGLGR